ncbi:hypothetical protein OE749_14855 [Aestuariibacter sp. AA17]|uniref:N-methyl-D-aspartate receptor NMDAR2C subunit n=1 Tax=Fluctibacter corallii TaxID=2984329 RepID=A0ABT3ABC2_9ALTE|nr:hypothetical protein [Aestuariibacter sp. AA17]MCV2885970.1 hypothetical protein [Aestuariibacter sp. AA17]
MLKGRWLNLVANLAFSDNMETFHQIMGAYSEKSRRYHAVTHLQSVLECLDKSVSLAEYSDEVELALWFHDAVYKVFSRTNESDSANWASEFLEKNGACEAVRKRVFSLVMATAHNSCPNSVDEKLIVDIDLSVLGQSKAVYKAFSDGVRQEYRRVPSFIYRRKRKAILASFLRRDHIFYFELFQEAYENAARENIMSEIRNL